MLWDSQTRMKLPCLHINTSIPRSAAPNQRPLDLSRLNFACPPSYSCSPLLSSAHHPSSHPSRPGCLLANNDALRQTEIDPPVQTSSRGIFSAGLGSLLLLVPLVVSFFSRSLSLSQSINKSLRTQTAYLGSLDYKRSRCTESKREGESQGVQW